MVLKSGHDFRRLGVGAFVAFCCLTGASVGEAADFRMVTRLYVDGKGEPVAENLTLFVGDMVYDFSVPTIKEVTILDTRTHDFRLVNAERRVQCDEVRKAYLEELISQIQDRVKTFPALPRFAAKPTFEVSYDDMSQRLILASEPMTYTVLAIRPENSEVTRQFRDFADWYARLNASLPGALPPGARLSLNTALMTHELVPREIERQIPSRQESIVSRHEYAWTISKTDQGLIERVNRFIEDFRSVPLVEYRRLRVAGQRAIPKH